MATELSKGLVGRGPGRVGPASEDRFFYQQNYRREGEDGRLDLARRGGGRATRGRQQEGAGARPELVTRSVL